MTDRPSSFRSPTGSATAAPRSMASAVVSRHGLAVALVLILVTAVVFGVFPGLDLEAAGLFYSGGNRFVGHNIWGESLRRVFYWTPFVVFAIMLALFLIRRAGRDLHWAPSGRGILFLAISLALGPGLLVNTVLKDHSHRPRPVQVLEFGGMLPFRPFYSFDGACRRNCSFVSGEGSAAFWTVAPALLAPVRIQPVALAGALVFGIATSLLRMAFGGHFLSDTIFAALFTWLGVIAIWRAVFRANSGTGAAALKPIVNHNGRRSRPG